MIRFRSVLVPYGVCAYVGVLFCLAIAAILPSAVNPLLYAILFVLAFPVSCAAVALGLISSAILFRDPSRNDIMVRGWVLLVWFSAILAQAFILSRVWQQRMRRSQ